MSKPNDREDAERTTRGVFDGFALLAETEPTPPAVGSLWRTRDLVTADPVVRVDGVQVASDCSREVACVLLDRIGGETIAEFTLPLVKWHEKALVEVRP